MTINSGFMKMETDERRYGYFIKSTSREREYTNFNPSTGGIVSKGVTKVNSLAYEKTNRTGKSSNPPKRLIAPTRFGYCFREPRNYRRTICKVLYGPGSMRYFNASGVLVREESGEATITAPHFGPNISSSLSLSIPYELIAQCQTEVLNKLKDQKIDIGTALAESRKTISHLADTSVQLYRFISNARKGRWSEAAKALGLSRSSIKSGKAVGNRWLEYQYAWRPLMADIHGAMEEIKAGFQSEAQLFSVTRNIVRNNSSDFPELSSTQSYGALTSSRESMMAKIYYRVNDSEIRKCTGLGLLNPLQVAWETVPFSFMLDWLLPVGDFLEALDATRGLDFIAGSRTYRNEAFYDLIWTPSYSSGPVKEGEYRLSVFATSVDRVRYSTFPLPSFFYIKKSPFTTKRLADAIAIGRQLFSSGMGHKR